MNDASRLAEATLDKIPKDRPHWKSWAEEYVVFPSSVRSSRFRVSIAPWIEEPIERAMDNSTRVVTFRKPVQTGGSVAGEVILLYWTVFARGMIQYNWSNDKRAIERWESRIEGILNACAPVAERKNSAALVKKGDVNFGNTFLRMQGAFNPDNLDSDSVAYQINEEVHSWEPGHLQKARNRATAVWNYKSVDISNAGEIGDQLDQASRRGTCQEWEVLCPGCRNYHIMRTRWEPKNPHLGGLRYDADGCRIGKYSYNYQKLRGTIRYQMPCGFVIHNEDVVTRRKLSASGRYSEPKNPGAELCFRSYSYDSVSVDFIDWMTLISQKHDALRARASGDIEPWRRYVTERENRPFSSEEIPTLGKIVVNLESKKNREGLPAPRLRTFTLDRQSGNRSEGELPHWWLVIRDYKIFFGEVKSLLVYEGRHETDESVLQVLDEHGCERHHGCADSGNDTDYVYQFCYRHGINAIKGGKEKWYVHKGGARRIYSPERPLFAMMNTAPKYPVTAGESGIAIYDPREPMFWLYSKGGIRERLHFMKAETDFETPGDVSDDYIAHNEAEERVEETHPSDGSLVVKWIQHRKRNDLFVCECYSVMLFDMAGGIGEMALSATETADKSK